MTDTEKTPIPVALKCRRSGKFNRRPKETRRFRLEGGPLGEHHYRYMCEKCHRPIAVPRDKSGDTYGGGSEICSVCDKDYPYPPINRRHGSVSVAYNYTGEDGKPCFFHIISATKDCADEIRFFVVKNLIHFYDLAIGTASENGGEVIVWLFDEPLAAAFAEWAKQRGDIFEVGDNIRLKGFRTLDEAAVECARQQIQTFYTEEIWSKEEVAK